MVVIRLSTVCSHSAAPRQKQNNSCVRTYTCLQTATGAVFSSHENNTVALKNNVAHCSIFRLFVVDIVLP